MIVFTTDFSKLSLVGLPVAESLAAATDKKMLIVHVMPHIVEAGDYPDLRPFPDWRRIRERLESIKPSDPEIDVQYRLLQGNPTHQIRELARREDATIIVVGTHGRSGVERVLMGSVAESLIRKASCAVVTVRNSPQETKTVEPLNEPSMQANLR